MSVTNEKAVYLYQHLFPIDVSVYFRQKMTLNRTRASYSSQLFLEFKIKFGTYRNFPHFQFHLGEQIRLCRHELLETFSLRHKYLRQFALFVRMDLPTRTIVFYLSFYLLNNITKNKHIAVLCRVTPCRLIKIYRFVLRKM